MPHVIGPSRRSTLLSAGLAAVLATTLAPGPAATGAADPPADPPAATTAVTAAATTAAAVTSLTAAWDTSAPARSDARLSAVVSVVGVPGTRVDLVVSLQGVRVTAVPEACAPSSTLTRTSSVSADGTRLSCVVVLPAGDQQVAQQVVVPGRVTSAAGAALGGAVSAGSGQAVLPARAVAGAAVPGGVRRARLVSSPDFLNADVGDLARGPGYWDDLAPARRPTNAINGSYRRSLDTVLDDWAGLAPDGVLVAGDLVEGRWGEDAQRTGVFGPLRTRSQQEQAVRRAARTFYPQWARRFTDRGLAVHPAIGDHELGDDSWPAAKRALVPTYREEFARAFTTTRRGRPVYRDRPRGPHAGTAYAFRPTPQVQVVSLDAFDLTPTRARLRVQGEQLRWLEGVLQRAQADGVRWTVVQAHPPVLGPVRARGSSELRYEGGDRSPLWRLMQSYGVDLYLAGEVHDVTLSESGGVTQLTHGGLFAFGGTTYALLDFYDDRIEIDLRDYDVRVRRDGPRLWETRSSGLPRRVVVRPGPHTIGTATITDAGPVERSGILLPFAR